MGPEHPLVRVASVDDPQVVLIGGPPGAGKSSLRRALATRLGWASLTGDDLVTAAIAITTPDTHPPLHPMTRVGHVEYFTTGPPEKLIADAIALEEAVWPSIARVIRRYLTLQDPIVLDWWLLSPLRVAELDPPVASFWIHIDPEVLRAREQANTDFFGDSDDPETMLDNFMARSLWRNGLVFEEAQDAGLHILEQDGSLPVEKLTDNVIAALR